MPVYYTPPDLVDENSLNLEGEEAKHILRVMRMRPGDALDIVDGEGNCFRGEILSIGKKRVECKILTRTRKAAEPDNFVTLASGLSTGSKFDEIIVRGTELGISRFLPLITDKSKIKQLEGAAEKRRLNRWRKVAIAAMKQSGRSVLPEIVPPMAFAEIFERLEKPGEIILFDPRGEAGPDSIKAGDTIARYTLIVGPESGFSPQELTHAGERNVSIISFGQRILRTENAGPSITAVFMNILGEFR